MPKYYKGKLNCPSHSRAMAKNITALNRAKNPDGFIYIFRYGKQDLYKIGVSKNVDRRLSDVDSASPVPIKEVCRHFFYNVYNMEEMIHDSLIQNLVRREWFKINEISISGIVQQIKEMSEEGLFLTRK